MKPFRQFCGAFFLSLALTLAAFAGEMDTGRTSPPLVEMPSGCAGQAATTAGVTAPDAATGVALILLQSLRSRTKNLARVRMRYAAATRISRPGCSVSGRAPDSRETARARQEVLHVTKAKSKLLQ
jgi:hypothetical protein